MPFYTHQYVFCPKCPPVTNKKGQRVGERLDCIEINYSGCATDRGCCAKCKTYFWVSYTVEKIQEILNYPPQKG